MKKTKFALALTAAIALTFNACQKTNSITQTPTTAQTVKHTRSGTFDYFAATNDQSAGVSFIYGAKGLPGTTGFLPPTPLPSSAANGGIKMGTTNVIDVKGLAWNHDNSLRGIAGTSPSQYLFITDVNDVANTTFLANITPNSGEYSDIEFNPKDLRFYALDQNLPASGPLPIVKIDNAGNVDPNPYPAYTQPFPGDPANCKGMAINSFSNQLIYYIYENDANSSTTDIVHEINITFNTYTPHTVTKISPTAPTAADMGLYFTNDNNKKIIATPDYFAPYTGVPKTWMGNLAPSWINQGFVFKGTVDFAKNY